RRSGEAVLAIVGGAGALGVGAVDAAIAVVVDTVVALRAVGLATDRAVAVAGAVPVAVACRRARVAAGDRGDEKEGEGSGDQWLHRLSPRRIVLVHTLRSTDNASPAAKGFTNL